MVVLVTCKNEEDSIKNGGTRVVTTFSITEDEARQGKQPRKASEEATLPTMMSSSSKSKSIFKMLKGSYLHNR